MRILVTGAMGFIGSAFIRGLLRDDGADYHILGFGRMKNARDRERLEEVVYDPRLTLIEGDLCDASSMSGICEDVDYVAHFAAKTFVDHSIRDPYPFIQSNVVGTFNLLEQARRQKIRKFLYVSTDEVYGSILKGAHSETSPLNPSNPYAATKAAGEMLALSYQTTYGLPVVVTRTENNYGPFQHRQKAIPTFVRKALLDEKLPIYGDGLHERMWLHVQDHCDAIFQLLNSAATGVFNVAGSNPLTNIALGQIVLRSLGKPPDMMEFIDDHNIRPGHDRRYALNCGKLHSWGWEAKVGLEEGLVSTINWYRDHPRWLGL